MEAGCFACGSVWVYICHILFFILQTLDKKDKHAPVRLLQSGGSCFVSPDAKPCINVLTLGLEQGYTENLSHISQTIWSFTA